MQNIDQLKNFEIYFPQMQVDRSSMKKGEYVPIHHHGGYFGFLYIVSGSLLVETYESKQVGDKYNLKLYLSRVYNAHEYVMVTKERNVHSIKALEDSLILDVFSVKQNSGSFQEFLKVVESIENELVTVTISVEEADVSSRLLTVETECLSVA